ncbi:MAG: DNA translocase FtsK 4TM domain-containing protein [Candidatus Kerfeldbacteria bacterium]|nr:DNA translocase FtsK 4TM domain-containing protein [Candidatus Kerfeldbacteria bacterium]
MPSSKYYREEDEEEPRPRRRNRRPRDEDEDENDSWIDLHPDTVQGILVVVMFLLAVLTLLALLDLAGSVGEVMKEGLTLLLGWAKPAAPVLFAFVGYALLDRERFSWKLSNSIGLFFAILGSTGLLHLLIRLPDAVRTIDRGKGGGYAGLALSYPLQKMFGTGASFAILLSVLLIGLLLVFRTSLRRVATFGGVFTWIKEKFYAVSDWVFGEDEETDGLEETPPLESEMNDETADFARKDLRAGQSSVRGQGSLPLKEPERKPRLRMRLSTDLLDNNTSKPQSGDIESNKEKIRSTLETFGIDVDMGEVNVGPTVTQYTLKPHEGVKLAQILTLQNDLALALAAHPIRIEAPIPGKSLVGIEIPNVSVSTVRLREILDSKAFRVRKSHLSIALGRDVAGESMVVNLDAMPHLLIAGATGSGKSVCINAIILSLLYQNTPEDLRLILVDPKRVEMTSYHDIPYLLTPVIIEPKKTINALKWAVSEMERRYEVLSHAGKRNLASYNASAREHMPYLVIIIDELADLMAMASQEVEATITRLAQMARAVGIHLVVATQRPSVDVITGLIKANITSRIAFTVASSVDSRTILDTSGAEKLLGRGDMLFISADYTKPKRVQGVYVSDDEINRVTDFLRNQGEPEFDPSVVEKRGRMLADGTVSADDEDPLIPEAQEIVVSAEKASASLLQRRLRVGYSRAARLLDILEERGIIGPSDGARPREVLLSKQALEKIDEDDLDIASQQTEEPPLEDETDASESEIEEENQRS